MTKGELIELLSSCPSPDSASVLVTMDGHQWPRTSGLPALPEVVRLQGYGHSMGSHYIVLTVDQP